MHLGQHSGLVDRQVDDAAGHDHVDAGLGQQDRLDVALEELDVRGAGRGSVAALREAVSDPVGPFDW